MAVILLTVLPQGKMSRLMFLLSDNLPNEKCSVKKKKKNNKKIFQV